MGLYTYKPGTLPIRRTQQVLFNKRMWLTSLTFVPKRKGSAAGCDTHILTFQLPRPNIYTWFCTPESAGYISFEINFVKILLSSALNYK